VGHKTSELLRHSCIDGTYSFKDGVLSVDPVIFHGPNTARHVRLLQDASRVGIPTQMRESGKASDTDEQRMFVHNVVRRPDRTGRKRPTLIVDLLPPR
jgi:hypothetical protein